MNLKSKITIFGVLIILLLSSSFVQKNKKITNSTQKYIERFRKLAKSEQKKFGIPASITMAQGILESRSGLSKLTKQTNNHFGIKCFSGCNYRNSYMMADDKPNDRFKIYDTSWSSFRDHSNLLMTKRYKRCRQCGNDYKCWAKNLKRCGYATSKKYSQDLIKIIECYQLHKLDN